MPLPNTPGLRLPNPDKRAYLDFMPGSEIPVIRQPFQQGDMLPFWSLNPPTGEHHLYRLDIDPDENENRTVENLENEMMKILRAALQEVGDWEARGSATVSRR